MKAIDLIREVRKPGPIYGDVLIVAYGDPIRTQLVKSDLLAWLEMFDPQEETGSDIITDDGGLRVIGAEY